METQDGKTTTTDEYLTADSATNDDSDEEEVNRHRMKTLDFLVPWYTVAPCIEVKPNSLMTRAEVQVCGDFCFSF